MSCATRELGVRKTARDLKGQRFGYMASCRIDAGVGHRSGQRHPVGLPGANVEDGGHSGTAPTSRPRVLLVVVSIDALMMKVVRVLAQGRHVVAIRSQYL